MVYLDRVHEIIHKNRGHESWSVVPSNPHPVAKKINGPDVSRIRRSSSIFRVLCLDQVHRKPFLVPLLKI
jgi:hypothetical protein